MRLVVNLIVGIIYLAPHYGASGFSIPADSDRSE